LDPSELPYSSDDKKATKRKLPTTHKNDDDDDTAAAPKKKKRKPTTTTTTTTTGVVLANGGGSGTTVVVPGSCGPAKELFSGKPDEDLGGGIDWPEGWVKKVFQRMSGATKGGTDKYWYSPQRACKLRSIKEVKRFLKAMQLADGNEQKAHQMVKTMKGKLD
jgi:hypothetical protein